MSIVIAVDVCIIRGHSVLCKMQRKSCKSHVFFLTENKATVYLIFTDMPARTHTWSPSIFYSRYITVNFRLKYVWFSGYPTDTPSPPLPLSILKDFPVRQYAQAACDTDRTSIMILCMCSFLEHSSDPSMKSSCAEPHMSWLRPCWYLWRMWSANAQESMCVCTISSGSRSLTKFKVDEDSSQIKILDIYVGIRCL